jgi:hypothetical protein
MIMSHLLCLSSSSWGVATYSPWVAAQVLDTLRQSHRSSPIIPGDIVRKPLRHEVLVVGRRSADGAA